MLFAGIFGGLVAKNFVQFVIFSILEPNVWVYFWGMLIIWIAAGICYCITGCCNAPAFAKILEATCFFSNFGFAIFGAVTFFGNPFLGFFAGKTTTAGETKDMDPIAVL